VNTGEKLNNSTKDFIMGMYDLTEMHIDRQQADMDTLSLIRYQKIHADTLSKLEAKLASLEAKLALRGRAFAYATA